MAKQELEHSQKIDLISGNLGTPGAPVLHLSLIYNIDQDDAQLSGIAVISQAVAPPNGRIVIKNVSGPVHGLGLGGKETRVFSLTGEYTQSFPPPAIGEIVEKFTATYSTDNNWQGHGTFAYGGHVVRNVPIKKVG